MGQYEKLIKEVYDELDKGTTCSERKYYDLFINNSKYPHLEEHNLWTYWQGRGVRNPKIMVVGQDWGSIEQSEKYYEYIKNHPDAKVVSYVQIREDNPTLSGSEFTTDKELRRFFKDYLGYPDICENHYDDIYFTNLIPGYRDSNGSTGNSLEAQKGVNGRVIEDFQKLLQILKPQVIICLGRLVGESIAKAYDKKAKVTKNSSFNKYLDEQLDKKNPKPIELNIGDEHCAKMFTISHLGSLGKANRTRYFNENGINKTVEDDWKVVADYIKKIENIKLEESRTAIQLKMCDIQGRLFELSVDRQIGSAGFIKAFMNSETAKALDSTYNRMQWAGEEYLLEEVIEAAGEKLNEKGEVYSKDVIYWIGYIYRYWHYYTGETSKAIYKQAPVETMKRNYMMFHTMAPEVAIEDLKEIYKQKKKERNL